jgi:hypothetical protein
VFGLTLDHQLRQRFDQGVMDTPDTMDLGYVFLHVDYVYVLLALKDNGSDRQLGIDNQHIGTLLWDQVHFGAYTELFKVDLGLLFAALAASLQVCGLLLEDLNLFLKGQDFLFHICNLLVLLLLHIGVCLRRILLCHDTLFFEFLAVDKDQYFSIIARQYDVLRIRHGNMPNIYGGDGALDLCLKAQSWEWIPILVCVYLETPIITHHHQIALLFVRLLILLWLAYVLFAQLAMFNQ